MKRFIAFSGGVESTAMCVLYGKGATAVFSDTGAEPEEMYQRLDICEQRLIEIHDGDFKLVRVKAKVNAKGVEVDNLIDYILQYKYFPSMTNRFCTKYFKILPIDNFLKSQGDCELLIGFNADEEPDKDRTGNYMSCKNVQYKYPLFDDGLSREDCEAINLENSLSIDWPFYMNRGGCFMCFYKGLPELKAMYFFDPKTFHKILSLEKNIQDRRNRNYTAMIGTGMTMGQIKDICENEVKLWGIDNVLGMYKKVKTGKACGAFCHR